MPAAHIIVGDLGRWPQWYTCNVNDPGENLLRALDLLGEVADGVMPERAVEEIDEATLQMFWREWPRTSAWAGALWRRLNTELAEPAQVADDADLDEFGGSG